MTNGHATRLPSPRRAASNPDHESRLDRIEAARDRRGAPGCVIAPQDIRTRSPGPAPLKRARVHRQRKCC